MTLQLPAELKSQPTPLSHAFPLYPNFIHRLLCISDCISSYNQLLTHCTVCMYLQLSLCYLSLAVSLRFSFRPSFFILSSMGAIRPAALPKYPTHTVHTQLSRYSPRPSKRSSLFRTYRINLPANTCFSRCYQGRINPQ